MSNQPQGYILRLIFAVSMVLGRVNKRRKKKLCSIPFPENGKYRMCEKYDSLCGLAYIAGDGCV